MYSPPQAALPVAAGGQLEVVAADLSQRQTLLPEMFEGVRAVVSCHSVKVQPKEGDTVDRAKYYQASGLGAPACLHASALSLVAHRCLNENLLVLCPGITLKAR